MPATRRRPDTAPSERPARFGADHRPRLRSAGVLIVDIVPTVRIQQFGVLTALMIGYALVTAIVVVTP